MRKSLAGLDLRVEFDDEEEARRIYSSLKPEVSTPPTHRSKVSISLKGKTLVIRIDAPDISSFRAAFNSYTRMLQAAINLSEALKARA